MRPQTRRMYDREGLRTLGPIARKFYKDLGHTDQRRFDDAECQAQLQDAGRPAARWDNLLLNERHDFVQHCAVPIRFGLTHLVRARRSRTQLATAA